ncbi:MAG: sigma-70 family RNA polymerase sigma factor [Deltaproteobacteria bacterium]|nr:sigma-70 family RNA polymerase sigma factor [Deltaproteobacteria bacterium]
MDADGLEKHALTLQEIHDRYQPKIFRYLANLIDDYEAEDLTQEVFAKVGRNLEAFRGEARVSTWIYRIATNLAIDRIRHCTLPFEDLRNRADDADEQIEDLNTWTGERPHSAEQLLIREEMTACIRSCLAKLPEPYRVVLALSDSEGFKNKETAEIMGVTLETVKIRLHRARVQLRKEIENNCRVYRDERNELACEPTEEFSREKNNSSE